MPEFEKPAESKKETWEDVARRLGKKIEEDPKIKDPFAVPGIESTEKIREEAEYQKSREAIRKKEERAKSRKIQKMATEAEHMRWRDMRRLGTGKEAEAAGEILGA